jgi:radical SAM-linked protein
LAYSHGFNPRPKLQLAAALPLGHTGAAELVDVWLEEPMSVGQLARALVPVLPGGLAVGQVRQVSLKGPPLQVQIVSAEYRVAVEWGESAEQVEARIEHVLATTELLQQRVRPGHEGKQYDLRPLIEGLWLEQHPEPVEGRLDDSEVVLGMQLSARQGATARPEAVLVALGMDGAPARYLRRGLVI